MRVACGWVNVQSGVKHTEKVDINANLILIYQFHYVAILAKKSNAAQMLRLENYYNKTHVS